MGDYVFMIVSVGLWIAFAWALRTRPVTLDHTWERVHHLRWMAKPVVWVAFLPWLSGLAIWESHWRTPHARRLAVVIVAAAFIVFWASMTFTAEGR